MFHQQRSTRKPPNRPQYLLLQAVDVSPLSRFYIEGDLSGRWLQLIIYLESFSLKLFLRGRGFESLRKDFSLKKGYPKLKFLKTS